MAFYDDITPNETKCQIGEFGDIECNKETERDVVVVNNGEEITIHVCAEHYELALAVSKISRWGRSY